MVEICSHCGALIPPSTDDLPHLSPTQQMIYNYIAKKPHCTANQIYNYLYSDDPNGGPEFPNIIQVYISQINRKLSDHKIKNISVGYPALYKLIIEASTNEH